MAAEDEKISALVEKTTLADTDLMAMVDIAADPDETKKITGANVKSQVLAGHKDLATGVHGVGSGTIGSVSTANKTIYVDKAASGGGTGVDWANAFTTIQAAVDSPEDIILHAYTIKVRKGATPYRETVYLNSNPAVNPAHVIKGSLTIEAEYYWQGDCEANAGGAGEITDTGAFADVAIGDKVYLLDLNGAIGRAQGYEVCTVDSVANAPNRIGTDGSKTPSTGWKYTIVRTEMSGSDDGTDEGTARDNCFRLSGINNVSIYGFYFTYSDTSAIDADSSSFTLSYCILSDCDCGIGAIMNSRLNVYHNYIHADALWSIWLDSGSLCNCRYNVLNGGSWFVLGLTFSHATYLRYTYIENGTPGVFADRLSGCYANYNTIAASVATGLRASANSWIAYTISTNSATAPVDPVGTSEGAYIV